MATSPRTIELKQDAYDLVREAQRRGVDPDALVDELVRTDLDQHGNGDLIAALDALAEFRAGLPPINAVALVFDALVRRARVRLYGTTERPDAPGPIDATPVAHGV